MYPKGYEKALTHYFRLSEFQCKCKFPHCQATVIYEPLLDLLEKIRLKAGGYPLFITSGFRCSAYNYAIDGSAKMSAHLVGAGVDLRHPHLSPIEIAKVAKECGAGGVGSYQEHVHVDCLALRDWTSTMA